jgi:hypothetical protein
MKTKWIRKTRQRCMQENEYDYFDCATIHGTNFGMKKKR